MFYLVIQKALALFAILFTVFSAMGQPMARSFYRKDISSEKTSVNHSIVRESSTIDYINFYQKYISEIRGQECPMYPSCSNFGLKSFKERKFATAFILVSDRLLRCGHDRQNYSLTLNSSGFKNLDYPGYAPTPVELFYKANSYSYAYADTIEDGESSIPLIKSLINDGFFSEALLEIKRSQNSTSPHSRELFINELICLKALGEFEKSIYAYEMRCPESLISDPEILYQLAINYSELGSYAKAHEIILIALRATKNSHLMAKLFSFQATLFAKQHKWDESLQSFRQLETLPFPQNVQKEKLNLFKNELPLTEKKPGLAALISVIPGAGYAYAGHKQTALSAFIINGLLTYATYSSIDSKNYGIGILTGVFNISFYIGNIYGASKSARRYNQQQKQNLSNKLIYNIQP